MTPECSFDVAVARLYDWQHGSTSFSAHLFTLFQKADIFNKERLAKAFPAHFEAITAWNNAPSEAEFFDRYYFKMPRP